MVETRTCLRCSDDFVTHGRDDKRIFCSNACRHKVWGSKDPKHRKDITSESHIEDLKYEMHDAISQIKSLRSSLNRIEHDYGDWEDRINAIENRLYDLEKEVGLEEEEISNLTKPKPKIEIDFNALDMLDE